MEHLRGDIFYVHKSNPITGSEQDAGRPAIIVSNDIGNKYSGNVEVVFLTTQEKKPLPTHVDIICKVPSVALCEQVFTVSKDRLGELIRTCADGEMKEIDNALMISLGLDAVAFSDADAEAKVKELQCKLTDAKKQIEDNNAYIDSLTNTIDSVKAELCEARKTSKETEPTKADDINVAVNYATILCERNIYKTMYEQLLEKVMSQKGC